MRPLYGKSLKTATFLSTSPVKCRPALVGRFKRTLSIHDRGSVRIHAGTEIAGVASLLLYKRGTAAHY